MSLAHSRELWHPPFVTLEPPSVAGRAARGFGRRERPRARPERGGCDDRTGPARAGGSVEGGERGPELCPGGERRQVDCRAASARRRGGCAPCADARRGRGRRIRGSSRRRATRAAWRRARSRARHRARQAGAAPPPPAIAPRGWSAPSGCRRAPCRRSASPRARRGRARRAPGRARRRTRRTPSVPTPRSTARTGRRTHRGCRHRPPTPRSPCRPRPCRRTVLPAARRRAAPAVRRARRSRRRWRRSPPPRRGLPAAVPTHPGRCGGRGRDPRCAATAACPCAARCAPAPGAGAARGRGWPSRSPTSRRHGPRGPARPPRSPRRRAGGHPGRGSAA